jgi:hypothetical protein
MMKLNILKEYLNKDGRRERERERNTEKKEKVMKLDFFFILFVSDFVRKET